jgi:hypothetical protein
MPEWHEQKAGVTDNREDRTAKYSQQNSSAPANAIQIPNAGSQHDRQQCESGPEVTVSSKIRRMKSDVESVAHSDESGRPESGRHNATNHARYSWVRSAP